MDNSLLIRYNTLLLVLTAGYCDTITFISADELFSAHVTGNFIIFAYDIIGRVHFVTWIRLLTFPVFVAAVITGGWLSGSTNKYNILRIEGVLLIAGGLVSLLLSLLHIVSVRTNFGIALLVVFAMGLQNAFGKLFSKETYGPTTMMTGNVTQAALHLFDHFSPRKKDPALAGQLKHDALMLTGFLCGCLLGGLAGKFFGLAGIIIPGGFLLAVPGLRRTQGGLATF